jgi:ribosomal protein RSM22 (predicted rRNA methylase)
VTGLPAWIGAALQRKLENVSRNELRQRAQAISDAYRADGTSDIIRSEFDALAYAVVRMPATYAAVHAALAQTAKVIPDFAPRSLLDVGAGPGTASFAACEAWPSLQRATLIDRNTHLLKLARQLGDPAAAPHVALTTNQADAAALAAGLGADMVMASYALTELAPAAWQDVLARLWGLAGSLLVIVEPGTTAGSKRVLAYRDYLLAAGARIVAPCSHDGACPLAQNTRWCHFSARLPRSRDHRLAKGADAPYEDEKFSYLVAGKGFGDLARGRRILATPKVGRAGVALTLCAPEIAEERVVARSDKQAYKAAKRCDWGDAITGKSA